MISGRPHRLALLASIHVGLVAAGAYFWQSGETRLAHLARIQHEPLKIPRLTLSRPTPKPGIYGAIQDRALFHRTRQFFVPPVAPSVPALPPLPDYRFAGAFGAAGSGLIATLQDPMSSTTIRVRKGDTVSNWSVSVVELRRVVLEFGSTQKEIGLSQAPPTAGLRKVALQHNAGSPSSGAVRVLSGGSRGTYAANTGNVAIAPRLYRAAPP